MSEVIGQYTTPTSTLHVDEENVDFTTATSIYVTFKQNGTKYHLTGDDVTVKDAHTLEVSFTQEQTGKFIPGVKVKAQINWTYGASKRDMTYIKEFDVIDNLLDKVI